MKKSILSLLFLVATITTQVKAVFIRGAIYEKNGQFIVLLGDYHLRHEAEKKQRLELMGRLKAFDRQSTLTLVEDVENEEIYKDHSRYLAVRRYVRRYLRPYHCFTRSPLLFLHSDLKKENLNVVSVECRYMALSFNDLLNSLRSEIFVDRVKREIRGIQGYSKIRRDIRKIQKLSVSTDTDFERIDIDRELIEGELIRGEEEIKGSCLLERYPLTTADVVNEIRQNIQLMQKFCEEIFHFEIEHKYTILDYYRHILEKYLNLVEEFIKKRCSNSPKIRMTLEDKEVPLWVRVSQINEIIKRSDGALQIVDLNIIHNILTNNDKKIIVVCAGKLHTSAVENFVGKIGYNLVKELGEAKDTRHPILSPINVAELFESLGQVIPQSNMQVVPYRKHLLEMFFEQKIENMMRNSTEQAARPLDGTAHIIKNQIRHNYSLMFPQEVAVFVNRRTQRQPLAIEWTEAQ